MPLGPNCRRAPTVLALALSLVLLAGCGDDEDPEPPEPQSSSATDTTSGTATTEPPVEPATGETTPVIEPATGILLTLNHAEIRMPEGWTRERNFGVPFLRQGSSTTGMFGTLTWTELNMAGPDKEATSLDAIAKRRLRVVGNPNLRRVDDAVIGGDTMAYRLVDTSDRANYEERYGVLLGNIEYSMRFAFETTEGTRDEAVATIQSMLATWDFNP